MIFSQTFIEILIYSAITLTGVAFVSLGIMVIKDIKNKELW